VRAGRADWRRMARSFDDRDQEYCESCRHPIRWTRWRRYPPAWTGAPSRGDVRNGRCHCAEKTHFASRLPQELFSRRD